MKIHGYAPIFLIGIFLVASIGLFAVSGEGATAEVDQFYVEDETIETAPGSIQELDLDVDGDYEYEGLNDEADSATVELQVKHSDGEWETIDEQTSSVEGYSGTGTYDVEGELFEDTSLEQDDVAADEGGESETTEFDVRAVLTVEDGDGDELVTEEATDSFELTVENREPGADVGGQGETTADGPDAERKDD